MKTQTKNTEAAIELLHKAGSVITHGIEFTYCNPDITTRDCEFEIDFITQLAYVGKQFGYLIGYSGAAWPTEKSLSKDTCLYFDSNKHIPKETMEDILCYLGMFLYADYEFVSCESVTFVENYSSVKDSLHEIFQDVEILTRNYEIDVQAFTESDKYKSK